MTADDLPEDWYILTLRSGYRAFENTLGFGLDAEVSTTFPWGDGVAGGDFVMHFAVDVDQQPLPPMRAETPLGSLVYRASETGVVNQPGDTDRFTVSVDRGQTMTVVLQTQSELQGQVEIRDSSGTIASATAASSGDTVVLQTIATSQTATENYTITVGGSQETYGGYTLGVFLNAAVEAERYGPAVNDTAASAQDIDASFLHLGRGLAQRGAVLGSLPRGGSGEDWYRFTLADGQSTALTLAADPSHAVALELYDGEGNLLATGCDVGGVNRVIGGFVDTTSEGADDAYFVRVSGTGVNYSLVVLRDAQFDAEPNDSVLPGVQDITRTGSVLGYVNWQSGQPEILEQKLTAEDAAAGDYFGHAVAISGDTAVVGSPNGGGGAVYVYRFEGADWQFQQKLTASDAGPGLVWEQRRNQWRHHHRWCRHNSSQSGAAYVFHFDGETLGRRAEVDGLRCCRQQRVRRRRYPSTAIRLSSGHTLGMAHGSAYVFRFNGSQWVEQQKLIASDGAEWDGFGLSAAICGDSIFVGAYRDDDNQQDSGSAYVFRFNGEQWTETQKLVASDPASPATSAARWPSAAIPPWLAKTDRTEFMSSVSMAIVGFRSRS